MTAQTVVLAPPQGRGRKKPAILKVCLVDHKEPTKHDLADVKDWSVIFEDVLEVKTTEGESFYYPLNNVEKWTVKCV